MGTQQTVTSPEKRHSIPPSTIFLLLALLIAVLAAWPLISQPGFLNTRGGGDSPFLLQRLQQLETALRDGHFPVRWMPDANYGYGYPFYNFYAPLSIYIAAFFRFLGFTFVRSIEMAQLAGFLAAAWGMFLLAQRWLKSAWVGLLASVAYTMAPFHLVNIYVRGDSLAEFWAMAWYPWILLAADSLLNDKGKNFPYGRLAALALAYAALILSHNISALIFTPFLLLYLLLRGLAWLRSPARSQHAQSERGLGRNWTVILLAILLGLALAAWFFIPALAEQELAQLGPVTAGFFHYSNHYRGLDLVQATPLFDYAVSGGRAFRLGSVQAIMTLLGALALMLVAFRQRLVSPVVALFILLSLLVATFMVTPLSRFLWDHLPLLPFTQFPWRFLSVQAFAAALASSALALLPFRRILVPVTAVLLIISSLAGLRTDHLLLADQDISPQRLVQYEWFTGNIGSTVSAEYLPPSVQPRPYTSNWLNQGTRDDLRAVAGELLLVQQEERKATSQTWQIEAKDSGAALVFPTLYWPGWRAEIDGKTAELQPAPGSGLIMLDLPAGEHTVKLQLGKTAPRWLAELISLVAVVLVVYALFKARRRIRWTSAGVLPLVLFVICLVFFRLWPQTSLSAANLTWDFAQMGYLHADEAGVLFDNTALLKFYEYDRQTVSAGEKVSLILGLTGANGEAITVALATAAAAWPAFDPEPPLIAEQTVTADGENLQFDFFLPENVPAGLIIPRVTIDNARPLTPSGKTRGDIFLRPLHVINEKPAANSGPELDVRVTDVALDDPNSLVVQLAWITRRQLSHNYNLSLRLVDSDGQWLSQLDTQPGYGFLPSSGWPVGFEVNDWLAMELPQDLPVEGPFALLLRLYEVESGEAVLSRRLGEIRLQNGAISFQGNEPVFTLPDALTPLPVVFGETIRLHGYQIDQTGADLRLTLYWEALDPDHNDYTRFVHIFDPETDTIVAQNDGQPRNNSYPTSQWTTGEIVADTISFDLTDVSSGAYQIGVGFYRQEGDSLLHLTAVDSENQITYQANRALLPDIITK